MKRKLFLFILAALMVLSIVPAMVTSAANAPLNCHLQSTFNIASRADVSYVGNNFWACRPQFLVDGHIDRGTYGPKSGNFSYVFQFDEEKSIGYTTVYCNGTGTVFAEENSNTASGFNENKITTNNFPNTGIQVVFINDAGEIVYDSNKIDTSALTSVTIEPEKPVNARQVKVFVTSKEGWGNAFVWEVEIYEQYGYHDWEQTGVTTNPTCLDDGYGTFTCDCGRTRNGIIPALGHSWSDTYTIDIAMGTHYKKCTATGCDEITEEEEHIYDNDCDASCNKCTATRTPKAHRYNDDCATRCDECLVTRTPLAEHTWGGVCDEYCDKCGELRGVGGATHVWETPCDAFCNVCNTERTPSKHVYDFVCDEFCNVCGGENAEKEPHSWSAQCDTVCNVCTLERKPIKDHKWSNNCDGECNNCGAFRNPYDHVYDNDCDNQCNVCAAYKEILVDHIYSSACDAFCNSCATQRTPEPHIFGEYTVFIQATQNNEGIEKRKCTVCGEYDKDKIVPMLEASNDSFIMTIVIVSVSVVVGGCTIIAVLYLVVVPAIKKSKLAKLEALKKAQEEAEEAEEYEEDEEYEESDESEQE